MTNANVAGMRIQEVVETPDLVRVDATIDGVRFQFAAYKGGAFEVYDYPKSWKGVPRFVGYLPKETSTYPETLGQWRVTRFDGSEPSGHITLRTFGEALKEAQEWRAVLPLARSLKSLAGAP